MDELGRVLVSLCSTIPDGLVVFFCSYDHLQKTYAYLEKTYVLNKIIAKKKVWEYKLAKKFCRCFVFIDLYGTKTYK
jgi:Rad3-related DNA helicase